MYSNEQEDDEEYRWQELVQRYWQLVKDHADDCDCLDCWEYYVLTEK